MKTTINMFESPHVPLSVRKAPSGAFVMILVVILAAAAVFGVYFYAAFVGQKLDSRIAEAESYINDPLNLQTLSDLSGLQQQASQYTLYEQTVASAYDALSAQKPFDSNIYNEMLSVKPARVSFTALSYADRTVTIECVTADNLPPADFAQALDGLSLFQAVEYQGFTGVPEEGYVFMIACVLTEGSAS